MTKPKSRCRIADDGFDMMWSMLSIGGPKANYPALKNACMQLRQMMMQKTAGQRKDRKKDLRFEDTETLCKIIVCEAMALVLSGEYEEVTNNGETD